MATPTDNKTRIDDIVNNSKKISELTTSEKRSVLDGIAPNGVKLHYLNPIVGVGDRVFFNAGDALDPGFEGEGTVTALPITKGNLSEVRKS